MENQWQPIETAPKFYSENLYENFYGVGSVKFLVFRGDLGCTPEIYIECSTNWRYYKDNGYTHWMPLPKPPVINN